MVEVVEVGGGLGQPRTDQALDDVVGDRRPAVDVHGPEDGLEGVGEDRRLLPAAGGVLAPPEQEERAEVELLGHVGEGQRVDDALADAGQRALREVGEPAEGEVGDDPAEDRVTEELEPLVADRAGVLGAPRAMGHRALEQLRVGELVPDARR